MRNPFIAGSWVRGDNFFGRDAMLQEILEGERDPYQLADLRDKRVRASREEVAHSLEGNWREDLLFELRQAVDSYQFAHRQMRQCDQQLEQYLAALPTRILDGSPAPEPATPRKRAAKPRGNAPAFDLKTMLHSIAGVDLTTIDGIDVMTAQTILAEVGPDLSAFPPRISSPPGWD